MGILVSVPKFFDNRYIHFSDTAKDVPSTESPDHLSAVAMNQAGHSVCFFPNEVPTGRHDRDCTRVRAWFVDLDYKGGIKPTLDDILNLSPLIPSYIVESSPHGWHVYFLAKNGSVQSFREMQERLIQHFGSDHKIKNLARLMRRPGFYHMKDPNNPFLSAVVFESDARYAENQMRLTFPAAETDDEDEVSPQEPAKPYVKDDNNIFDYIRHYNSRAILTQLSGTQYVGFKQYRFLRKGAHYNIVVDGKDTGSFINEKGTIIATDERYSGGAVEWLLYYPAVQNNRIKAMRAIKEVMSWD